MNFNEEVNGMGTKREKNPEELERDVDFGREKLNLSVQLFVVISKKWVNILRRIWADENAI